MTVTIQSGINASKLQTLIREIGIAAAEADAANRRKVHEARVALAAKNGVRLEPERRQGSLFGEGA